ncbi:unannotated protein [freshwater metagenome]|uniref:Unannotated protein n=1 Tax=freshwater metagenome TaxID=449393 RepID=A0A6J7G1V0_9ZZZZ|nr:hypothetical protein [Actinomycetota bacterium]
MSAQPHPAPQPTGAADARDIVFFPSALLFRQTVSVASGGVSILEGGDPPMPETTAAPTTLNRLKGWAPGYWGKAFIDADGQPHVWATAVAGGGQEPTRGDAAAQLTAEMAAAGRRLTAGHLPYLTPISIQPSGAFCVAHERGAWEAALTARPALEHDPRFRPERYSALHPALTLVSDHDAWMTTALRELH